MAATPYTYEDLGLDLVLLQVGQMEPSNFRVHKKLLFEKAPQFKNICRGAANQDNMETVVILDDYLPAVAIFVEWLYRGTIMILNFGNLNYTEEKRELLLTLHFLAIKYHVIELADRSLSGYLVTFAIQEDLLTPRSIREIYERTVPMSKLRLAVVQFAAYGLQACPDLGGGKTVFYAVAFYQNADLMLDVLKELRPRPEWSALDPRKAPKCIFHDHPYMDNCPYGPLETIDGIYQV